MSPSPTPYRARSGAVTWQVRFRVDGAPNPVKETFLTQAEAERFCRLIERVGGTAARATRRTGGDSATPSPLRRASRPSASSAPARPTTRTRTTDMDDNALRGLLGDAYGDTTDEQRDAITRAADAIDARWPDYDLADTRRDALDAALAVILGDTTDEETARAWHTARAAERQAHARLTGAIIAGAVVAPEPETRHAARLHVTRVTLRKALGR